MKNELKEWIKTIVEKDKGNFHERVKSIVPPERADAVADGLQSFIQLIPDFIAQIRIWMKDPQIPSRYKELHGFFMTYLFHEEDYLPEADNSLFGYLDDAYMIGSVYLMTRGGAGFGSAVSFLESNSAEKNIPRWLEDTRKVIPGEVEKIDRMLVDILQGNLDSFHQLLGGNQGAGPRRD